MDAQLNHLLLPAQMPLTSRSCARVTFRNTLEFVRKMRGGSGRSRKRIGPS